MDGMDGQDGQDGRDTWLAGEGLVLTITDAAIATDGTITVDFSIADGDGTPLDLDGLYTPGPVNPRFIAAWLDENTAGEPLQYTAYTTRDQTSPITSVTETQASTDSGGTFEELGVGQGTYRYTFGTLATSVDDTKTHTIGVYATRNFEDERYVDNATFDFVPDGSTVGVSREVVLTDNCNQCHNPLQLHGGSRRDVELCILCHSPQTVDPDTGNTVDMKVMIHKIHRGRNLPSVQAGGIYEIIGYMQRVHDYSHIGFPGFVDDCDTCHGGAADGDFWRTRQSRALCTSCHDTTSFVDPPPEGMVLHTAGDFDDDTLCTNCHGPDEPHDVAEKHLPAVIDPTIVPVDLEILAVDATPGQPPVVDFRMTKGGAAFTTLLTEGTFNRLRFTYAGPTTDYEGYTQVRAINGSAFDEGTLGDLDAAAGEYRYTFPAGTEIPVGTTGSYGFGMEAREAGSDTYAFNPVFYADVNGGTAEPRRTITYVDGCNACHNKLAVHGGSRQNPEYCAFCHNPNNTNDERSPGVTVEGDSLAIPTVDLKVMIHKIHRSEDLVQDYVLYGFGGSLFDVKEEVHYPGDLRACWACHTAGSFDLPLAQGILPTRREVLTCDEDPGADGDTVCDSVASIESFTPPTTAVCTACHDGDSTAAHAEIMTTSAGAESCTTCHGPNSVFDIAIYHQLDP